MSPTKNPLPWSEEYLVDRFNAFATLSDRSYFFDFEFADIIEYAKIYGDYELIRFAFKEAIERGRAPQVFEAILLAKEARKSHEAGKAK